MGTVYKETYTKPIPEDAELITRKGERFVRWTDKRGRKRTARVTTTKAGVQRLVIEASTYTARYRDGLGCTLAIGDDGALDGLRPPTMNRSTAPWPAGSGGEPEEGKIHQAAWP